jgi:hypothetical protein
MNKPHATTGPLEHKVMPPDYIERLPDALAAACCHPGEFAMGLRDGTILFFDQADYISGSEWVHLYTATGLRDFPAGTGVDIRLTEITWAVDGQWKAE